MDLVLNLLFALASAVMEAFQIHMLYTDKIERKNEDHGNN